EYYQTRTEASILRTYAKDLGRYFDRSTTLVELGSGSSTKTRILLDSMEHIRSYIPIDISEELLTSTVQQLNKEYPHIEVTGVSADYTQLFTIPIYTTEQKVFFFPGSTIGNFEPKEAVNFLRHIQSLMSPGDRLIIGMDRKKKRSVIEAAYNDQSGVTEKFNKNLLTRLNREWKANINEEAFSHLSFYNEEEGRIEMHLKSEENQIVKVNGEAIFFAKEETIHTENSYKFNLKDLQILSEKSGFTLKQVFSDEQE
ncbi:L-histidine N(alpha)-methyltransferase, partial [Halobacillus trueperi]|uniref:L-histidine N(alpha)-methyltransferase n=1 Tax=Halobacillus trueperi TaxID=156205 RepID=UPI0015F273AD